MIGDKLLITDYHRAGAAQALELIRTRLVDGETLAITVAGESGSGKSEIGHVIAETLTIIKRVEDAGVRYIPHIWINGVGCAVNLQRFAATSFRVMPGSWDE